MTQIKISTIIAAPIDLCFDLSRSIELHVLSTRHTGERAIEGLTTGIAEQGDIITWEATHFGIRQRLTTVIERVNRPVFFSDRMIRGAFRSMYHEHIFESNGKSTTMTDVLQYTTPGGIAGRLFDVLVLKKYMTSFLKRRNETIREAAEGDGWKEILK